MIHTILCANVCLEMFHWPQLSISPCALLLSTKRDTGLPSDVFSEHSCTNAAQIVLEGNEASAGEDEPSRLLIKLIQSIEHLWLTPLSVKAYLTLFIFGNIFNPLIMS